ncbi:hypothetical protein EVAR_65583_1 [Eumeta japonica]|uniref:PDEase domain-containing protein n=1 Tax=Eumeta variegata TaxID=151549 RepID=A0A4C1Z5P7_EUMVA|nr:hypothetical protein EVAR_65583_1 [Eumeta japonica]
MDVAVAVATAPPRRTLPQSFHSGRSGRGPESPATPGEMNFALVDLLLIKAIPFWKRYNIADELEIDHKTVFTRLKKAGYTKKLILGLMREEECNIVQNLSRDEFREFRTLVIDMVLATDMSFHFQQLKNMRSLLTLAEPAVDKSKAVSLVLHCCDISHPAKRWDLHHRWTMSLLDEFFLQGDKERELGLPFSPLCDRNNTLVAESQIGFIEFIVEPSMGVCADMLECVLGPLHAGAKPAHEQPLAQDDSDADQERPTTFEPRSNRPCAVHSYNTSTPAPVCNGSDVNNKFKIKKPWIACLSDNKKIWKEQAAKDAEARAKQEEDRSSETNNQSLL